MIPLPLILLARVDAAWLGVRKRRNGGRRDSAPGAGVHADAPVSCIRHGDVWWPDFPALAHSFWRAQEVTLFRRHAALISGKVLDLGCGDGMFGQIAGFPDDLTGADFDRASLEMRRRVLPKAESVWADAGQLPFPDASFNTVVSNSVFEHLPNLEACFSELHRVLVPGGCLLFTMTLGEFTRQLRAICGQRDAAFWVREYGHHQEPSRSEVETGLRRLGFDLEQSNEYQPLATTRIYRRLLSPAESYFRRRFSRREEEISSLVPEVLRSLDSLGDSPGACLWVVARKVNCGI